MSDPTRVEAPVPVQHRNIYLTGALLLCACLIAGSFVLAIRGERALKAQPITAATGPTISDQLPTPSPLQTGSPFRSNGRPALPSEQAGYPVGLPIGDNYPEPAALPNLEDLRALAAASSNLPPTDPTHLAQTPAFPPMPELPPMPQLSDLPPELLHPPTAAPTPTPQTPSPYETRLLRTYEPLEAVGSNDPTRALAQGTVIDLILLTRVDSSLPGTVLARTLRNVYTHDLRVVIVPAGSQLLGTYSQLVGSTSLELVWQQLTLPDGRRYDLGEGLDATASDGTSGLPGQRHNHTGRALTAAFVVSALSAATQLAQPLPRQGSLQALDAGQVAAAASAQNFGELTRELVRRGLDAKPTLTAEPGTLLAAIVHRTIRLN